MTQDEINQLEILLKKARNVYPKADIIYAKYGELWGSSFDIQNGTITNYNDKFPEGQKHYFIY